MTTSAAERLNTLEALRGIAALLVVLYHLQDIFGSRMKIVPFHGLFGSGDRGVDIFFVLSGFIIMTTHGRDIGSPERVLPYLYKRCCRIFPSVWIMTLVAGCLYACNFGGPGKSGKLEPWNIAASALLLPQTGPALVNVTWTLKYEIFFYGLFALLIVSRRFGSTLMLAWQGAMILMAIGVWNLANPLAGFYFRPICIEFGVGMTCAWLFSRKDAGKTTNWISACLLVGGAASVVGGLLYEALWIPHGLEATRVVVFGLGSGATILGLTRLERVGGIRAPAFLVGLGSISYAVYLLHYSVITLAAVALVRMGWIPPTDTVLLCCALLGVAAGGAFHHWIDAPIQRQLRRLGRHLLGSPPMPGRNPAASNLLAMPQASGSKW